MACTGENYPYPRGKKTMEDDLLTLDDVTSHVTHRGAYNGVRIREFDDGYVNPQPLKTDEEEQSDLWEEFLSPNKLKSLTGVSNLTDVTFLEMQVNTNDHSLGNFGGLLPNLIQLKLSNSVISTVRDLGTSLSNLKTLWLCRCGLTDLDGISSISSLVELYVAFNDISDVSPVSMLDNLEVLDLEGNLIDDLAQVEFLTLCSSLKSLNLEGNPVCVSPHPTSTADEMANYDYCEAVHQAVPGLKVLDDELLLVEKVDGKEVLRDMPDSAKNVKVPDHLKAEWQLINDGLKTVETELENEESSSSRPSSGITASRPNTAAGRQRPSSAARQRPSSAARQRPSTAARQRPSTAARQRPATAFGQRPGSALGSSGSHSELTGIFQVGDDSSDLTHGSGEVICGNISKALKARRKNIENVKTVVPPFSDEPRLHVPEKSYEEEEASTTAKTNIFEELKEWRQQFTKFINEDHSLPTTAMDSESENDSPFSSPRRTNETDTSPSSPPTCLRGSISPTPPPASNPKRPSPMGRSLPNVPLVGRDMTRPHTSGEFRMRRYRHASTEQPVDSLQTFQESNSLDVNQNHQSTSSIHSRVSPPGMQMVDCEPRSSSAPVRALRRYRVLPNTPGTATSHQPEGTLQLSTESPVRQAPNQSPIRPPSSNHSPARSSPSQSPISQTLSQSPVSPMSHGFRPGTAAAALQKRRLRPNDKI